MVRSDIRLYLYMGHSNLTKPMPAKLHKHRSISDAMTTIKDMRAHRGKRYHRRQIVLIDYTNTPSKIILINDPSDETNGRM